MGELRKTRVLFIVNPISGINRKNRFPDLVAKKLDQSRYDYEVIFTQHQGHATELASKAVAQGYDLVVAVGGDGTINEIARALIGTRVGFGIIPSGSGNGLARHLNIPLNQRKALQIINKENYQLIDTATINGHRFCSLSGVGFDAMVAEKFAQTGIRGFFSYLRIIILEYFQYNPKTYQIILDDKEAITEEAFFITFANSNQFGYGVIIAPEADLQDGLLDVCIVKKPEKSSLLRVIYLVMRNQAHRSNLIQIQHASKIKLIGNPNYFVNIDGDPLRMNEDIEVSVNPKSLKILTLKKR
ncbi:MAG: diacylglycerol kinase family lipid kinase [Lentimicrobiaceae bacterium]|jgi:YegS/Rv2252/BmrU family lipid kinase|nr:diacylglycerol kinase family lipid kinase [Lentimicrobiaceae bacterium]